MKKYCIILLLFLFAGKSELYSQIFPDTTTIKNKINEWVTPGASLTAPKLNSLLTSITKLLRPNNDTALISSIVTDSIASQAYIPGNGFTFRGDTVDVAGGGGLDTTKLPLAGGTMTGDIEMQNSTGNKQIKGNNGGAYIEFLDDGTIGINNSYGTLNVDIQGIDFNGVESLGSGMRGLYYYGNNADSLTYIQRKMLDDTTTMLKGLIAAGGGASKFTTNGYGILVDSTSSLYIIRADSSKLKTVISARADSIALAAAIALKLNITDTANMRPRLVAGTNTTITGTYPNLTINAATQTTDTSSLSSRINAKLNISDTASMLANYQTAINGKGRVDSIRLVNTGILHTTPATFSLSGVTGVVTQTLATQSAYKVFARGSGSGTPSFNTLDSNYWAGAWATQVRAAQNNADVTVKQDSGTTWLKTGNNNINAGNFIGSTNNSSLRFRTNNVERFIVDSIGQIGIGLLGNSPISSIDIRQPVGRDAIINLRTLDNTASLGYAGFNLFNNSNALSASLFYGNPASSVANNFIMGTRNSTSNLILSAGGSLVPSLTIDPSGSIVINNGNFTALPSAVLDINSTSKGLLIPRMTSTQRDAISSPAPGLQIYNITENELNTYNSLWGWEGSSISYQRKFGSEWIQDFYTSANNHFSTLNSGGTYNTSGFPSSGTGPGIANLSTSTSATGRACILTGEGSGTYIKGFGTTLLEAKVRVSSTGELSNSTQGYMFHFGFGINANNVTGNSMEFLYDSLGVNAGSAAIGNWQVVCSNGTTRTYTTTNVTVAASTWYTLKIIINAAGTQVDFYINDVLVKSETSNIPTGISSIIATMLKSTGTIPRIANIDYIYFKQKFTTPR